MSLLLDSVTSLKKDLDSLQKTHVSGRLQMIDGAIRRLGGLEAELRQRTGQKIASLIAGMNRMQERARNLDQALSTLARKQADIERKLESHRDNDGVVKRRQMMDIINTVSNQLESLKNIRPDINRLYEELQRILSNQGRHSWKMEELKDIQSLVGNMLRENANYSMEKVDHQLYEALLTLAHKQADIERKLESYRDNEEVIKRKQMLDVIKTVSNQLESIKNIKPDINRLYTELQRILSNSAKQGLKVEDMTGVQRLVGDMLREKVRNSTQTIDPKLYEALLTLAHKQADMEQRLKVHRDSYNTERKKQMLEMISRASKQLESIKDIRPDINRLYTKLNKILSNAPKQGLNMQEISDVQLLVNNMLKEKTLNQDLYEALLTLAHKQADMEQRFKVKNIHDEAERRSQMSALINIISQKMEAIKNIKPDMNKLYEQLKQILSTSTKHRLNAEDINEVKQLVEGILKENAKYSASNIDPKLFEALLTLAQKQADIEQKLNSQPGSKYAIKRSQLLEIINTISQQLEDVKKIRPDINKLYAELNKILSNAPKQGLNTQEMRDVQLLVQTMLMEKPDNSTARVDQKLMDMSLKIDSIKKELLQRNIEDAKPKSEASKAEPQQQQQQQSHTKGTKGIISPIEYSFDSKMAGFRVSLAALTRKVMFLERNLHLLSAEEIGKIQSEISQLRKTVQNLPGNGNLNLMDAARSLSTIAKRLNDKMNKMDQFGQYVVSTEYHFTCGEHRVNVSSLLLFYFVRFQVMSLVNMPTNILLQCSPLKPSTFVQPFFGR